MSDKSSKGTWGTSCDPKAPSAALGTRLFGGLLAVQSTHVATNDFPKSFLSIKYPLGNRNRLWRSFFHFRWEIYKKVATNDILKRNHHTQGILRCAREKIGVAPQTIPQTLRFLV